MRQLSVKKSHNYKDVFGFKRIETKNFSFYFVNYFY